MHNGIAVEGKVVEGEDNNLSTQEQGQLARGEIDAKGKKTDKEVEPGDGVKTIKTGETLYHGPLSAEATSSVTGEKVSLKWEQAQPTTEEGCWHSFNHHYGGMCIRDTFKLDPKNEVDPTLRTSLEK